MAPDPFVDEATRFVRSRLTGSPAAGIVLGSGLGGFAKGLRDAVHVPYSEVPRMPSPTVPGHSGSISAGFIGAAYVVCLSGRVHLYEGRLVDEVVFGSRVLAALGCRFVLLTNAAGGIRQGLAPGDLLLIEDHLNLTGNNPLRGSDYAFVDMTAVYDSAVRDAARAAAHEAGVPLASGVYAGLVGPSYETPAEIRMLRTLGADAVGMSTVLEAIALRRAGVRVGAVSCITNLAAGLSTAALDHREVQAVASAGSTAFEAFLSGWVARVAMLA